MKVRVAVVMAVVLGLFSSPAFAQLNVTGGVKGGIGWATISAENDELQSGLEDSRTGMIIGGFVEIPATNMFSVLVEGLYSQKGATGSFTDGGITFDNTLKYDVIEIPILANFPVNLMSNIHPFVYGGIAPAFKVSAKFKEESALGDFEEDLEDDEVESFDVGLVFGGGVQLGAFGIEARYNWGLMNVNAASESEGEGDVKLRQFAVLINFSIPR